MKTTNDVCNLFTIASVLEDKIGTLIIMYNPDGQPIKEGDPEIKLKLNKKQVARLKDAVDFLHDELNNNVSDYSLKIHTDEDSVEDVSE